MSLGTILLIILILMLMGAVPAWPHSKSWGYGPSGGLGLVLIVVVVLGGIYGVRFVEGAAPDTGALVGTFRPINPAEPAVVKMFKAVKRGLQGLMGLSIDATAKTRKRQLAGKTVREAVRFVQVNSVDLIVEPGAGGGLDRLVEGRPSCR